MSHNNDVAYALSCAQSRESFAHLIAQHYDPRDTKRERKYFNLIMQAHDEVELTLRDSERENNEPSIVHPRAAAAVAAVQNEDWRTIIACLLHDTVEDYPTEWSFDRIKAAYGLHVMSAVRDVTKPDAHQYAGDRFRRDTIYRQQILHASFRARKVKIVDRYHNLVTIWSIPITKAMRKVFETYFFYLPLARDIGFLDKELEVAVKHAIKEWDRHPELQNMFLRPA